MYVHDIYSSVCKRVMSDINLSDDKNSSVSNSGPHVTAICLERLNSLLFHIHSMQCVTVCVTWRGWGEEAGSEYVCVWELNILADECCRTLLS